MLPLYQRPLRGMIMGGPLIASVLVAFLSVMSLLVIPVVTEPLADMHIEPTNRIIKTGGTFTVRVVVDSQVPTNVFKGEIHFDERVVSVESIEYNTSIANLWAEKPWYADGDGTINFIGGTTRAGGFVGDGVLLSVTFYAHTEGETTLDLEQVWILEHDGLGSDLNIKEPIDTLFTVEESVLSEDTISEPEATRMEVAVMNELPRTDINGDGKQNIADVSIFMMHVLSSDPRSDFNQDGNVDTVDLSILMSVQ